MKGDLSGLIKQHFGNTQNTFLKNSALREGVALSKTLPRELRSFCKVEAVALERVGFPIREMGKFWLTNCPHFCATLPKMFRGFFLMPIGVKGKVGLYLLFEYCSYSIRPGRKKGDTGQN